MAWSPIAWCSNNLLKYFFVILWMLVNAIVFWRTYNYYKYAPQFYYLHEMLGAGLCVSRATANVANLNLGALLLPTCRSIMAALRSLSIPLSRHFLKTMVDHCKGFHILCAYILVVASVAHFFGHVFNAVSFSENYNTVFVEVNAASYPKENPLLLVLRSFPGVTGVFMLLLLVLTLSSSVAVIRHSTYELFWYTHRLFIVFYILVFIHGFRGILKAQTNLHRHRPGCFPSNETAAFPEPEMAEPEVVDPSSCSEPPSFDSIGSASWIWVTIPLLLYCCDVIHRLMTRCCTRSHVVGITYHPGDVIELHVHKEKFTARPGQFILLQCPTVSVLESHPYTITKVPVVGDPVFSVHIKVTGDWTGRLKAKLFEENEDGQDTDSLLPATAYNCRISIEGPFSSPLEDCLRYRVSLWVAGGIGVTPFVAHLHSLREASIRGKIHRIYFIWLCKDYETFLVFAQLLCDIYEKFWEDNRPDGFQVSLHITGQRDPHGEPHNVVKALYSGSSAMTGLVKMGLMDYDEVHLGERFNLLARRLSHGRPCWKGLLRQIAESHSKTTIGTFTCGPESLVDAISRQCSELRKRGTTFQCYKESF